MTATQAEIVAEVLEIRDQLLAAGVAPDQYRQRPVDFWRFPEIEQRIASVADRIVALNPKMLSQSNMSSVVRWPVLTNLIDERLWDRRTYEQITPEELVERELADWIDFEAWLELKVPVLHSAVGRGNVVRWGEVTLEGFNPWSDLPDTPELKYLVDLYDGRFNGMASVMCPGDTGRQWEYLTEAVETALRQMVGASWPAHAGKDFLPPGIVGRTSDTTNTHIFEGGRFEYPSQRIPPGHPPLIFPRDAIAAWGEESWARLAKLSAKPPATRTDLEEAAMSALAWLGAASEPDIPAMQIVKVATALEALVGDAGEEAVVTGRGITATLAERVALLVAEDQVGRIEADSQIRQLYKLRSRALHRGADADPRDLGEHGQLVWRATRALVDLLGDLRTRAELQHWTLESRYSQLGAVPPLGDVEEPV